MRAVSRNIVGFIVALTVLACDDSVGLDEDVELIAEVRQADNLVVLTVGNRSSDTIYYHSDWLERREDGRWEWVPDPPGTATIQNLLVLAIKPGQDHVVEHEINNSYEPLSIAPGEYRFRVNMSADGSGNVPSEDAGASNSFQIDP